MKKRKINISIIIIIFFILSPAIIKDADSRSKFKIIDNFEYSTSKLLRRWYKRKCWSMKPTSTKKAAKIYKIQSEAGKKYLHASTVGNKKLSIALFKFVNKHHLFSSVKTKWNLKSYPNLSWKWRVLELPKGASEKRGRTNDSAAAIYIIFQRYNLPFLPWDFQPVNVLIYTWSTTLPKGKVVYKKKDKYGIRIYNGRYTILQSGKENLGKMVTEKRNIYNDYKRLFKSKPPRDPIVIGIHTHSDKTKTTAIADYDDIKIER